MPDVKAHLTKAILKSGASDDGKYGLLGFLREQRDSIGQDDIWIGVPVELRGSESGRGFQSHLGAERDQGRLVRPRRDGAHQGRREARRGHT